MSRTEIPVIHFALRLTLDWTFFGLTPTYKVQKQDRIFELVYHSNGGFTYSDVYHMPVYLRTFYIRKLQKMFDDQKKQHEKEMKKVSARTPKIGRR